MTHRHFPAGAVKQFETLLWKDGSKSNPLGQASVTETIQTTIDTNADGTLTDHVNPSSRPYSPSRASRRPTR